MADMDPSVRLLRLLSLLPSRPWWSGQELASRLSVSPRTLRRDVTRLRELGYPVQATGGHAGGYTLGAAGRMPPLLLDDEEAVATTLGLQMTAVSAVAGIETSAVAALAKLDRVLPPRLRERVRALHEATVQLPSPVPVVPAVDPAVLTALATACWRTETLRFSYTDHAGRISARNVEPYQIVQASSRWYLVANDRDRCAWRTFRIDRITAPALTGQRHKITDPPDAAALVMEATQLVFSRYEARIQLDLEYEKAAKAFRGRVVEPAPDGKTILRVAADDLASLASYATGLAYGFEILAPPELRTEVRRRASEIATRHTADSPTDRSARR
jgi:predicted DNA-binding transcriptional regulator YafY